MLYTKIQPPAFLVLELKTFKCFFTIYGHSSLLFNRAKPLVQTDNVKSGKNWLRGFREEYTIRLHDITQVHRPGARTARGQNFDCNEEV